LVNGARTNRQKSTLVQSAELIEQGRQYLTFDDPGVLGAAKLDPNGFYRWLNHPGHPLMKCSIFPSYFRQSKFAVDPKTGSGSLSAHGFGRRLCCCLSYPSPWAGRIEVLTLWPFFAGAEG